MKAWMDILFQYSHKTLYDHSIHSEKNLHRVYSLLMLSPRYCSHTSSHRYLLNQVSRGTSWSPNKVTLITRISCKENLLDKLSSAPTPYRRALWLVLTGKKICLILIWDNYEALRWRSDMEVLSGRRNSQYTGTFLISINIWIEGMTLAIIHSRALNRFLHQDRHITI